MKFADEQTLEADPDINIIPLIDVLFFIIIFFVMSTSFTQSGGVDVNLPSASTKRTETKSEELVITLGRSGELAVKGARTTRNGLAKALSESAKLATKPVIVIQADKDTAHGQVVDIMDLARQNGFEQLAIATVPADKK